MKLQTVGFLIFLLSSQTFAMSLQDYEEAIDTKSADTYLGGIVNGLYWANASLSARGQQKLFCAPRNELINLSDYKSIIDSPLNSMSRVEKADNPLSLALLVALENTYPCH